MRRAVKIIGILIVILLLGFLFWFFGEYKIIRQGMYQLISLTEAETGEMTFNLSEEDNLELISINGVYLGRKKQICQEKDGKRDCDLGLRFLSLDSSGNPLIYNVYVGEDENSDYQVKNMVETDGEDSYGITDISSQKMMEYIKLNDVVELYIIERANINNDTKQNDKSLEKIVDLALVNGDETGEFLNRFTNSISQEKELISLVKGFWKYRNMNLAVYVFNIL